MQAMTLTNISLPLLVEINLTFNTFRMPLNFLSAICNGEISLREAETFQRKVGKKMEELKDYRP